MRRQPHLPTVAAWRATADRDRVGGPWLAHCAEGRGSHGYVSGHMAVLGLGLGDSGVFGLGGRLCDRVNARGHASLGDSDRCRVFDGGLRDPDVVNQASGCDHFSECFL